MTMDSIAQFLASEHPTAFSFEILPPLRGGSIDRTYQNIERLMDFAPAYVNITTHRTQVEYRPDGNGTYRVNTQQKRPGTVAVAAAIRERFHVRPVPHVICGEYSRAEIEDQLIDLSYLGITDILVLRGDRERNAAVFTTHPEGHEHASSLAAQVCDFNRGRFVSGDNAEPLARPFSFGVAGYPEKHEEAMNLGADISHLKEKIAAGASYIVTQMFFDNARYFDFVKRCREEEITVPIIPGLKPLTSLRQKSLLPRTFHLDFPEELSCEFDKCKDDAAVKALGVEWALQQGRELKAYGVPSIHFYAMNATESVASVARQLY